MFKEYYISNKAKKMVAINELFATLNEADEDIVDVDKTATQMKLPELYGKTVRLTTDGIKRLFKIPTRDKNVPEPTDEFQVIDNKSDEGKEEISSAKSAGTIDTIIAYSPEGSNGTFFDNGDGTVDIPPTFFSDFTLDSVKKVIDSEDLEFVNTVPKKKNAAATYGKNTYLTVSKEDAIKLIKIYHKVNVRRKSGSKFEYYYLKDLNTDTLYQIIVDKNRDATLPSKVFSTKGAYAGGDKYKPNSRAQENETLAVVGFFVDAVDLLSKIEQFKKRNPDVKNPSEDDSFQKIISPYIDALKESNEYKPYKSNLLEDCKNFGYADWEKVLRFAAGPTRFLKEVAKLKTPYLLHKSIDKYRTAETDKMGYATSDRTKASTVDAILSDVPAENLLELVVAPMTKLVSNPDRRCIEIRKDGKVLASYYQLSLKEDRNQKLGRSHEALKKKYDFVNKAQDMFDGLIHYDMLINEGAISKLTDVASNGLKMLKQIGSDLITKLIKLTDKLKNWKTTLIANIKESFEAHVVSDAHALFDIGINESTLHDEVSLIVSSVMKNSNNLKEVYDRANAKITKAFSDIESSKASAYYKVHYHIPTLSSVKNLTEDVFYGMINNYSYLQTIKRMLIKNIAAETMEAYIKELVDLYVDAMFGSTELPVWKIFVMKDSNAPYEYLGSKAENAGARSASILAHHVEDEMPLVIIDANKITNGFHIINMYTLSKLVDDNGVFKPMYVKYNVNFNRKTLQPLFMAQSEVPLPTID